MSERRRIEIYDTTLRDGTQGEGFNLSLQDKLLIAQKLDELGVDYVEGGFPLSNPKDEAFFQAIRTMKLKNASQPALGPPHRSRAPRALELLCPNILDERRIPANRTTELQSHG